MYLDELKQHKKEIALELVKMEREYEKNRTNHFFHLILTLLTGIWVFVWWFVASGNKARREELEPLIDESKAALIEIDSSLISEIQSELNKSSG